MKILALFGSPRQHGNTRAVLDQVLKAAHEAGADVELVDLSTLKEITGCHECYGCQQSPDEPGCVIDDDIQGVLAKVTGADLVLFATPVFCWSMSWLLKIAVDRMFCMFKFEGENVRSLLEGRAIAGVVTAGGEEAGNADIVPEAFKRFAAYSKCDYRGSFVAAEVESPETIQADRELCERAREFGRGLVSGAAHVA